MSFNGLFVFYAFYFAEYCTAIFSLIVAIHRSVIVLIMIIECSPLGNCCDDELQQKLGLTMFSYPIFLWIFSYT